MKARTIAVTVAAAAVAALLIVQGTREQLGQRRGRVKTVKRIHGKQYRLLSTATYQDKDEATRAANDFRAKGYAARLIRSRSTTHPPTWRIYTRRATR